MEKYVREIVKQLKPYVVTKLDVDVKLDANEGVDWQDGLNRYPDDSAEAIIDKLAAWLGKSPAQLMVGNGSSELIELILKTFLEPGEKVMSFAPTFSMYEIFTLLYNGRYVDVPLRDDFTLDVDAFIAAVRKEQPKIVLMSNPNNPTGVTVPKADLLRIVEAADAVVVIDEAYIEFGGESAIDEVEHYDNLVVLRTFSKAVALAGIRLGYLAANETLTGYIRRVKSPYNLNAVTQRIGLSVFDKTEEIAANVALVQRERARVETALAEMGLEVVPSDANFVFFRTDKCFYDDLVSEKVLIRRFGGELDGWYRMTVGTPEENRLALEAMGRCLA